MRDLLSFAFVMALAAGGALHLASQSPADREFACASAPIGGQFHTEYCRTPQAAPLEAPASGGVLVVARQLSE